MIARLVAWCSRHPWPVIVAATVLALAGDLARRSLPRDAIPDLSDPQVVLVADWMGHPALEVAERVTRVLGDALHGVPGVKAVRGSSMAGMASLVVVFDSPRAVEPGRQEIVERAERAREALPRNVRLQVGPAAASTGWWFQYVLVDRARMEPLPLLRNAQDRLLAPALAALPGVAEVASVGGDVQQALIEVRPEQLRARGLAFTDVVAALSAVAQEPVNLRQLSNSPLAVESAQKGASFALVGDVAHLSYTRDMPTGLADYNGVLPAVGGIVVAKRDADPATVAAGVRRTLEELRPKLPEGVQVVTVYDRLDLVARVEKTLLRALAEEVVVVVLVILAFLLHARSALVPLATLPLVVLLAFAGMWTIGLPATLMSLAGIGIALGMAVDADVVALEACHRRLESLGEGAAPAARSAAIADAAGAFAPAILTALVIAALSFLPVLAFTGETGRLLEPLALGKTLVVVAAALVAVTLAPALRERLLRGRVVPEFDHPVTRGLVRAYRPFVHFALRRPALTLATAALAVLSCVPIVGRLGGEFLPRIDEGDLLFMPTTLAGVPPGEASVQLRRQDRAISQFPEVATVFGKVGRATSATDPAPYSMAETTIRLRPRAEWPPLPRERWYSGWAPEPLKRVLALGWPEEAPRTMAELVEKLDEATRLPGWSSAWTAPARARLDMTATGVRTPVGIRVVAPDPARLNALGAKLQEVALRTPGTRSAIFESLGGEPWPRFEPDPAALKRFSVPLELVEATTGLVIAGGQLGEMNAGGQPYRVRIAPNRDEMDMSHAGVPARLREVTVRSAGGAGQPVPLALLGRASFASTPALVRSERRELVAYVHVDLHGSDVAGYLRAAGRELGEARARGELALGAGERIEWTGQHELMAEGERRLAWIVPAVALLMLLLLYWQFRSFSEALIVLAAVPFALVGSFWTLYLLGYPLSAPVWVGLLSTAGLAMQTGVVMVVYIDAAFYQRVREGRLNSREDIIEAHAEGTVRRLRPKIMTVAIMAAGLLPLLWADGAGAEIMRRVAAPMLGGLLTSAFLTLEVLPVLYTIWRARQLREAQRRGVPIEQVVGSIPAWGGR